MFCVFQNIDPHPLSPPGECVPPPLLRGEDTLAGWRGGCGVNILEDARHRYVLYLYRILFAYPPTLSVLYHLSLAISCFANQLIYQSWPLFMTNLLVLITKLGLSQNPQEQASSCQKLLLFTISFRLFHRSI
jgi:hypothetical protein